MLTDTTDLSFSADVLDSAIPVLVDFWAPWCGPCKLQTPVLEQLAAAHPEKLRIVKVNIDEQPEMAMKLGVRGLPTLMVFRGGERQATATGLQSLPRLEHLIAA